jgi:transposase
MPHIILTVIAKRHKNAGGQIMNNANTEMYLGMDVSEKSIELFALSADNKKESKGKIENNPAKIKAFLADVKNTSRLTVALETGTHSPWLSKMLEEHGCKVLVGHARKLRAIWGDDHKCDQRDAEMLARIARMDPKLLHPIKHVSQEVRAEQAVIKARDVLVKTSTMLINHLRGTLRSFGISTSEIPTTSMHSKLMPLIPKDLRPALRGIVKQLKEVRTEIKEYDKKLTELCKKHKETKILQQLNGVGPVTAITFALIIADPRRFSSAGRVGSYLGLTPKRDQSGEVDKQLGITKSGNGMLRKHLVKSANYIMGPFGVDSELRRYGERIAAKGGKIARRKAKVAVARKLAVTMWRLWINEAEYDPFFKEHQRQKKKAARVAA